MTDKPTWNYRVFRCADPPDGSVYYEIRETHYDAAKTVNGWAESGAAPMGETFKELIHDIAWVMAALNKPVLDEQTGLECEPAQMLTDDIQQWVDARADAEGEA